MNVVVLTPSVRAIMRNRLYTQHAIYGLNASLELQCPINATPDRFAYLARIDS